MNQISVLQAGAVPAHIAQASNRLSLNAAAHQGLQASFGSLKIRGKQWRVRYRGEEIILKASPGTGRDGKDLPIEAVRSLDVVVVGMATAISKKFYVDGYVDGVSKAPDCFSVSGIAPDPASAVKQSPTCATCPQNIWGSAITDAGKKAKACRDGRRLAVVPAGDEANETYGGPMLLDIPPTSLINLDRYVRELENMGADISQVVTRISFSDATQPQLVFTTVTWVPDAETYALICELGESDQVHRMLSEEVVAVTYDAQAEANLGSRPAHLPRSSPGAAVNQPQTAQAQMVDVAQAALAAKAAQAQTQERGAPPAPTTAMTAEAGAHMARAQAPANTTVVKKASPFGANQAQVKPVPLAAAPAAAKNDNDDDDGVPTNTTVVQGAPPSMQDAIDSLLN